MSSASVLECEPSPALSSEIIIALRDVAKSYGREQVLQGITLDIHSGEALAIIGPSGAGKSTLLQIINRLIAPTSGSVFVRSREGVAVDAATIPGEQLRRDIGMVFQEFNLWPNKTILHNLIEAPIYVAGMDRRTAVTRAEHWLERVGISDHRSKYPAELSGGQQQRAAIARTLMMEPRVVLFDEITSALDVGTAAQILDLIDSLREANRSYVFVTHHLQFAERRTDRTAVVIGGHLLELGRSADVIHRPERAETKQFLSVVENCA